jgi:hypothetical protein
MCLPPRDQTGFPSNQHRQPQLPFAARIMARFPGSQTAMDWREPRDGAISRVLTCRKADIIVSLSQMAFRSLSMRGSGQV